MIRFRKNSSEPDLSTCVSSTFSTVLQVMNQMVSKGEMNEVELGFIGPMVFRGSCASLVFGSSTQVLLDILKIQQFECTSLSPYMSDWVRLADSYNVTLSAMRQQAFKAMLSELVDITQNVVRPMFALSKDRSEILNASHRRAFDTFEGYFSLVDADGNVTTEVCSVMTNLMANSYTLFISDLILTIFDDSQETVGLRIKVNATVLTTISALFGAMMESG